MLKTEQFALHLINKSKSLHKESKIKTELGVTKTEEEQYFMFSLDKLL